MEDGNVIIIVNLGDVCSSLLPKSAKQARPGTRLRLRVGQFLLNSLRLSAGRSKDPSDFVLAVVYIYLFSIEISFDVVSWFSCEFFV